MSNLSRFSARWSTIGAAALLVLLTIDVSAEPRHGIAMHGEPAVPQGFDHLPFVNPDAPQGGSISYGVVGDFDNLNPVIVRSAATTARGIFFDPEYGNLVFEPLMFRSPDEPFTLYGLLAETVETDAERTFVEFQLRPEARFSDGRPVRPEDLLFTTEMMRRPGVVRPQYTNWLSKVETIEKVGERGIRFTFNERGDRELPLLLASLPVLPEHEFDRDTFERTTLDPLVGSGPYTIAAVEAGRRIVYQRDPDYWGKDLPLKRGLDNYDEITIEYFRDGNVQFEAFKRGIFHVFPDTNPRHWQTAYDVPAVADGRIVKESFRSSRPPLLTAFFFNTRRPVFADRDVRAALASLFDFEWANANLHYGAFTRTTSYFDGSDLSSVGRPAGEAERRLLAPYGDDIPQSVLEGAWRPSVSDGSGSDRKLLRAAVDLLSTAGYRLDGGRMLGPDGRPLAFEILVQTTDQQRVALAYARTLGRIGVAANVRQVDDAQYQLRRQSFDYDLIMSGLTGSLSPGAEQVNRWGSAARDGRGSFNFAGVAEPAVDAMIAAMVNARSREDYVPAVRAFDRVLIAGQYIVPLYHIGEQWLARWSDIRHPEKTPLTGYYLPSFWREPAAD